MHFQPLASYSEPKPMFQPKHSVPGVSLLPESHSHNRFSASYEKLATGHFNEAPQHSNLMSHQYLVKKYGNKLPADQSFNIDDLIIQISDVFCIVCEQYVSQNDIRQHSKTCSSRTNNEIEQIEDVQEKLTKCNFLIQRIKKMLKIYCTDKQQVIQYLQMLWKCCFEIIQSTSEQQINQYVDDLELFLAYFGSQTGEEINTEKLLQQINTVLYKIVDFSNRKQQLVKQNVVRGFLQDSIASSNVQGRFRNPFDDMTNKHLAVPVVVDNYQSKASSNNNYQPLNQLQSKSVQSRSSDIKPINAQFSAQQMSRQSDVKALQQSFRPTRFTFKEKDEYRPNTVVEESHMEESRVQQQGGDNFFQNLNTSYRPKDDNKAKFFNLASQVKSDYPLDHPAQTVLIAGLYEKANKTGVKPQDYDKFIRSYYDDA